MSHLRISRCRLASVCFLAMTVGLSVMAIWPWWQTTYEARATLKVVYPENIVQTEDAKASRREYITQVLRLAKSQALIDRVVMRLEQEEGKALRMSVGLPEGDDPVDFVDDNSNPVLVFRTNIFYFEAWGANPEQASALANLLAEEMVRMALSAQIAREMPSLEAKRIEAEKMRVELATATEAAASLGNALTEDVARLNERYAAFMKNLQAELERIQGAQPDAQIVEAAKPANAERVSYRREYVLASAACLLLAGVFCRMGWFGKSGG